MNMFNVPRETDVRPLNPPGSTTNQGLVAMGVRDDAFGKPKSKSRKKSRATPPAGREYASTHLESPLAGPAAK